MQVLDGPESAVHRLYATIREDPRDASAETPLPSSAAERTFPNWETRQSHQIYAPLERRSGLFSVAT